MDSWFVELFEILSRQTETMKTDRFLPKLYDEFNVLTRARDIEELQEIYQFTRLKNPIKTTDSSYNDKTYIELKKEIITKLLLLNDFSMLDLDINELLEENNSKKVDEYLKIWKSKTIVYNHLKDIVDRHVSTTPIVKKVPEKVLPKKVEVEPVTTKKIEPKPEPVIKKIEVQPETKPVEKPEPSLPKNKIVVEESKPKQEAPKVKLEPKIEKPVTEIKPVPKTTPTEIKPQVEIPRVVEKKPIPTPTPTIVKSGTPIEEVKLESLIPDFREKRIQRPVKQLEFIDFVTLFSVNYEIKINLEILKNMDNPKPTYFHATVDFVDSKPRNARFFIEMFQFLELYGQEDLKRHIIDRSWALKRLVAFNMALINETDIPTRCELVGMLGDEVEEHVRLSRAENILRRYIEQHHHSDEMSETMKMHATNAAYSAPSMIEAFQATEAIDYFINNVISNKHQLIDIRNLCHVYWSLILAASVGIYVKRSHVSDYTESMDWISSSALLLAERIEEPEVKDSIKVLATSYVTKIYRLGCKSDDYDDWWERQRDDLRESKNDNLASINSIS